MTSEVILQVLLTISTYCHTRYPESHWGADRCLKDLYTCSHNTNDSSIIPTLVDSCIRKDLEIQTK